MPPRIEGSESGAEGIRRILRKEIEKALGAVDSARSPTDEGIHDARKRLKRARAALRLIREALGDREYRRENRILRDAARPLSEIRDAKILIDIYDDLTGRTGGAARPALQGLSPMRTTLVSNRRASRRRILGAKGGLKPSRQALESALERAKDWPASGGWPVLGAGLRRVYAAGREAFAAARRDPTADNLHEWRKQAKYLWHQLEFLEPIAPSRMKPLAKRVHELSDLLGDDHDLAVLEMKLGGEAGRLTSPALGGLLARIDRRRGRLQARARALGRRIYAEPPQRFLSRLGRYWRRGDGA